MHAGFTSLFKKYVIREREEQREKEEREENKERRALRTVPVSLIFFKYFIWIFQDQLFCNFSDIYPLRFNSLFYFFEKAFYLNFDALIFHHLRSLLEDRSPLQSRYRQHASHKRPLVAYR